MNQIGVRDQSAIGGERGDELALGGFLNTERSEEVRVAAATGVRQVFERRNGSAPRPIAGTARVVITLRGSLHPDALMKCAAEWQS